MNIQSIHQDNSEETLYDTFSVYLNQPLNAIYIDLDTEDTNVSYIVYDKKGQIIKEKYNLSKRNTLSLNPFPSGLYTIVINDRRNKVIKKVLKF
ncbi:T9SS type A sorting domain-containing protein [uncultured Aquimarina sp.]|uniref:T9SS type A sorting domain-containing protein n=1 Tax=uncultured Aquimarina sp. TaxID=575652 RepID=UPI00263858F9|nr:T9SS type A sorting domain-containing protein [uncultured Aquimarina sp.]